MRQRSGMVIEAANGLNIELFLRRLAELAGEQMGQQVEVVNVRRKAESETGLYNLISEPPHQPERVGKMNRPSVMEGTTERS